MEARDEDGDVRGFAEGMLERLDADDAARFEVDGAGRAVGRSPVDGLVGNVLTPFPGLAIGCSGLTGPPTPVPGGGTTTTPGG
jgi:hypothetical protein